MSLPNEIDVPTERIVVAMSGGVDSSVAAAMLVEQGADAIGVTMRLSESESRCCSLEDADDDNKIVIMTYHSAKGLDFDAVCLPFIDVDLNITTNENALILVALSRAKRDLLVSYSGNICLTARLYIKSCMLSSSSLPLKVALLVLKSLIKAYFLSS